MPIRPWARTYRRTSNGSATTPQVGWTASSPSPPRRGRRRRGSRPGRGSGCSRCRPPDVRPVSRRERVVQGEDQRNGLAPAEKGEAPGAREE